MKKIIIFISIILVVLCLLFLSKYFLKSKKIEIILKQPEQAGQEMKPAETPKIEIIERLVSWGFQKADGRKIDTIIIHSSYDANGAAPYDVDGLIKEYKQYKVTPHYLIDRNGKIYQLVEEKNIAYQAGKSQTPDGRKNVNDFSIGIEMMNMKTGQMTDEQYQALNELIGDIKSRYEIKYVLGHNQIASDRKDDPWNLDWEKIWR